MSLRLCTGCSRHVREEHCPFCGAEGAPIAAKPLPRVARIPLLGAAAATVVATGCGTAAYGGPPIDGGNDVVAPDASDAGQDAMATFYGGVPIDSGTE
jgi:hypothetical protein